MVYYTDQFKDKVSNVMYILHISRVFNTIFKAQKQGVAYLQIIEVWSHKAGCFFGNCFDSLQHFFNRIAPHSPEFDAVFPC